MSRALLFAPLLLLSPVLDVDRAVKLNGPLFPDIDGDITHEVTTDGSTVVYLAQRQSDGLSELYRRPADGSGPPVLILSPDAPGIIGEFRLTMDDSRVVYVLYTGVPELWIVPVDGSASPLQLTDSAGFDFVLSPDGTRAAFVTSADQEVFEVPLDASQPATRLSAPGVAAASYSLQISPDSARVLYFEFDGPLLTSTIGQSDTTTELAPATHDLRSGVFAGGGGSHWVYLADVSGAPTEVYTVPADGSAPPERLNNPLLPDREVERLKVAPDGSRAVYIADEGPNDILHLYSVPTDGSSNRIRISGTLLANRDVEDFEITPDSTRVVYTADQDTNGVEELFIVPIDVPMTTPIKLNVALTGEEDVGEFAISSDSQWAAYTADDVVKGWYRLFGTPLDGSVPAALLADESPTSVATDFQFVGDRVLYTSRPPFDVQLKSVPRDGSGTPVRLNPIRPVTGGNTMTVSVTQDTSRVTYISDQRFDTVRELFSSPVDGSQAEIRINEPLWQSLDGDVYEFAIDPAGERVVYRATQNTPDLPELFSVPLDAGAPPVLLSGTLPFNNYVQTLEISPDSSTVFYTRGRFGESDLFRVPIDGSSSPLQLTNTGTFREVFEWSLHGSHLVYVADPAVDRRRELYSVTLDGNSVVRLSTPLHDGADVSKYRVDPTETRAVYRADDTVDQRFELFSSTIGVPSSSLRLNAALPAGGTVVDFELTEDGSSVVYTAEQSTLDVVELFVVPIDGSAAPLKLNGVLPVDGDVSDFVIASGGRVAYLADADVEGTVELYSVLLDGTGLQKLNGSLVADGDVTRLRAGPGRIAYVADQDVDGVFELFAAPVDGSSSAYPLSGPLPATADVSELDLAPGGARVLYLADAGADGDYDLFSVPLDGTAAAVRLHPPLDPGGDASLPRAFLGDRALYRADATVDGVSELFEVPVGGGPALRVNDTLVEGGNVLTYAIHGRTVVYRADQDQDGANELYATELLARPSGTPTRGPGSASPASPTPR